VEQFLWIWSCVELSQTHPKLLCFCFAISKGTYFIDKDLNRNMSTSWHLKTQYMLQKLAQCMRWKQYRTATSDSTPDRLEITASYPSCHPFCVCCQ
jgi:hypothetical protein